MMDANEALNVRNSNLQKLLEETTLIDIFSIVTGKECNVGTYIGGKKGIDFMFPSGNPLPYISSV